MKWLVEIHGPNRTPERHELRARASTLGVDAPGDLRVSMQGAVRPFQLELVPGQEATKLTALSGASIMHAGAEHTTLAVAAGEEVFVNGVRLLFVLDARGSKRPSPLAVVLSATALLLGAFGVIGATKGAVGTPAEVEAPELDVPAATCEETPTAATHRAREARRTALGRRERYPFDASEGIPALKLLEEAAACFRSAALTDQAAAALVEAQSWRGRLNQDYATLRLRLRVALDQERHADALGAVGQLEHLLAGHGAPAYMEWLAGVRRRLERKEAP